MLNNFYPAKGCSRFLWNVGTHLPDCIA